MSHYDTHLSKALEFYDEGNYEGARAALNYALSSYHEKDDCRAAALMAHTYRRLEYDDEARKLFEECLAISPTPDVLAELALILAEKDEESERAIALAMQAINEDSDLASAYHALFLINAKRENYIDALKYLKRGIRRGIEYSETKIFESVRAWCQALCAQSCVDEAFAITTEIVDFFADFDFIVLHARIAEFSNHPRVAVEYYKKSLPFLRSDSPMRLDILETIAKLAI